MKKFSRKGFMLIELLATIAILVLVVLIALYLVYGITRKAREKAYQVTISNIEGKVPEYVTEASDKLFYITGLGGDYEYQCITVQSLIDYGYLDKNVTGSLISDSRTVSPDDYIYIERNPSTKTITKSVYILDSESQIANLCASAIVTGGDITFISNPVMANWSKYKDITITYKLNNVMNVLTYNDYNYNYSYDNSNYVSVSDNNTTKVIKVNDNGNMYADIRKKSDDYLLTSNVLVVSKIDNKGPIINNKYSGFKTVRASVTIPVEVTDMGSGVDYETFTLDDIEVYIGETKITTGVNLNKKDDNGNYEIVIVNREKDGELKLIINKDQILDKVGNGNERIEIKTGVIFDNIYEVRFNSGGKRIVTLYTRYNWINLYDSKNFSTEGKVPIVTLADYTFNGWYTEATGGLKVLNNDGSFTGKAIIGYTGKNRWQPSTNIDLYANMVANTYTVKLDKGNGTKDGTKSVEATYLSSAIIPQTITLATKECTVSGFELNAKRKSDGATVKGEKTLKGTAKAKGYYTEVVDGVKILEGNTMTTWVKEKTLYTDVSGNWLKQSGATLYAQYDDMSNVTLPTITKKGYTCGWTDSETGTSVKYASGSSFVPEKDTVLYGVCGLSGYTVNLNKGSGTKDGTTKVEAMYLSSVINPSTITLAKKEYTVSGFGLASKRKSDGATVSSTGTLTSKGNIKGYYTATSGGEKVLEGNKTAAWVKAKTTYTDANGNWNKESGTTLYAQFDAMSSVTLPTISKSGYTCGWTDSETGTSVKYASGAKITPDKNITLYGVCTTSATSYKITLSSKLSDGSNPNNKGTETIYKLNGVGVYLDSGLSEGKKMLTNKNPITVPSSKGYVFMGYYTGASGTGTKMITADGYVTNDLINAKYTSNVTLYAYWNGICSIDYYWNCPEAELCYPKGQTAVYSKDHGDNWYGTLAMVETTHVKVPAEKVYYVATTQYNFAALVVKLKKFCTGLGSQYTRWYMDGEKRVFKNINDLPGCDSDDIDNDTGFQLLKPRSNAEDSSQYKSYYLAYIWKGCVKNATGSCDCDSGAEEPEYNYVPSGGESSSRVCYQCSVASTYAVWYQWGPKPSGASCTALSSTKSCEVFAIN